MKLQRLAPNVRRLDTSVARPAPAAGGFGSSDQGTTITRGYGWEWQQRRLHILERDGYLCRCDDCARAGLLTPATHVDHVVEKADGGTDDDANLRAMNAECHKRKTAAEQARRRCQMAGR